MAHRMPISVRPYAESGKVFMKVRFSLKKLCFKGSQVVTLSIFLHVLF